jgi:bifunctional N-acetylglucosamine-1-phosphate-uridyltransferase/glucosamine-1-phosphate-acetyltransferase GlmU-like protein
MPQELTTKKLKKLSLTELNKIADQFATKLQWLHSTGKNESEPEKYKRVALELYHIAQIIEEKEALRENKKYKYN